MSIGSPRTEWPPRRSFWNPEIYLSGAPQIARLSLPSPVLTFTIGEPMSAETCSLVVRRAVQR